MKWDHRLAGRIASLAPSEAITDVLKLAERPEIISFAGGLPDPKIFPLDEIQASMERVMREDGPTALNYGPGVGYTRLREWIAHRMTSKEQVNTQPDNIVVTSGGVEALHLICMTLLEPGDTVIVGAPTYLVALHVFRAHQINMISVPLDENGLSTDELKEQLKELERQKRRPKLVYVVPSFQNPSGLTMSLERREELIRICQADTIPIVEDHAYAELRFEGTPVTSLKSLDPDGVILTQTFSKIFAPGVRLGWAATDADLVQRLALFKIGTDSCANTLGQRLVYRYAQNGGVDKQVAQAIELYRRKRNRMMAALENHLGELASWTHPQGGFYIWLTLPESLDSEVMLKLAIDREKTAFVAGPAFFADGSGARHVRLSYSFVDEKRIDEGILRLARTIKSQL